LFLDCYFFVFLVIFLFMPNIKSAEKALRQTQKRRKLNLSRKNKLDSVIKTYKKLVTAQKREEAIKQLPVVYKIVDSMAKVEFIKKNKAKRLKSRLAKKLSLGAK